MQKKIMINRQTILRKKNLFIQKTKMRKKVYIKLCKKNFIVKIFSKQKNELVN